VAIPAFSLLRFLLLPVLVKSAKQSRENEFGLLYQVKGNRLLKLAIAFLLLDYTNYLWHILLHKIPLLWRFHLVHHSDLDLDLTTAFRFHFGELIGSVFYRGSAVYALGATPKLVLLYEAVFEGATQFHHTNWKLPYKLEMLASKLIVTPRMHGIHHSMIRQETDSNYAVIFSFWDRLHKTARLNVPQTAILTGLPAYSNPVELTITRLWKLPFTNIRPWPGSELRKDGIETGADKSLLAE
jgi:sterol desaturase/sphingolipid hydroxylase (fatty acid hydroxylase superfamily)